MRACNCARASPFQSRTCEGCDRCYPICCRLRYQVSIHAPAWGATGCDLAGHFAIRFQSTHPRGVRLSGAVKSPGAFLGFNPRTRVGCDCGCWCGPTASSRFNPRTRVGCDVSHAKSIPQTGSFNPRTRVGCDLLRLAMTLSCSGFNPRTRVGCDTIHIWSVSCTLTFQSTHPRGVRRLLFGWGSWLAMFQSTHPRGVRPERFRVTYYRIQFQSTHPRGVRPADHRPAACRRPCFNPRTRVGCDLPAPGHVAHATEFQSTHPRGVRQTCHQFHDYTKHVSIHAPAWGATWALSPLGWQVFWFQSTHPRGVRPCGTMPSAIWPSSFNPRTRVGCDATWPGSPATG